MGRLEAEGSHESTSNESEEHNELWTLLLNSEQQQQQQQGWSNNVFIHPASTSALHQYSGDLSTSNHNTTTYWPHAPISLQPSTSSNKSLTGSDEKNWVDVDAAEGNRPMYKVERRYSQTSSLWDGSTRSALTKGRGGSNAKKRKMGKQSTNPPPLYHSAPSSTAASSSQARQKALQAISISGWNGDCLAAITSFLCEDEHCFSMMPMGNEPRGYLGEPMRVDTFEIRVIDPPKLGQRVNFNAIPPQTLPVSRPLGRSLHLIITKYPRVNPQNLLDAGFALLTICHRQEDSKDWLFHSLVTFSGHIENKRTPAEATQFVANLDRYTKADNGKRIWGERTSHVRNEKASAKPLRLEPRGAANLFGDDRHYCVVVTLHDPQGHLLFDVQGQPCIAQSNPFFYEKQESSLTQQSRRLLEQFEKLSVSQKTLLVTASSSLDARQVLLSNSHDTQVAAGVVIGTNDNVLPNTACSLDVFFPSPTSPLIPEYISRLKAVAAYLGKKHANSELTDRNVSFLKTINGLGVEGRFQNLYFDGKVDEHQAWLASNGVSMKIVDVHNRSNVTRGMMHVREYRSRWIICVDDVNPRDTIIDRHNDKIVYCLREKAGQDALDLTDRHYPLARLAFTSKLPRSMVDEVLFHPYTHAFVQAGGNGTDEVPLNPDKFWLILHLIFLDYFLYWVEFRGAESCLRIQRRLLEDDQYLDPNYFGQGKMIRFNLDH